MRLFLYSSSVLPNNAAHPIQILNTVRALAERPDVEQVEAWFYGLEGPEEAIWARYGLQRPPRARLRAMLPGPLLRLAGRKGRLQPKRRWIHRWAFRRIIRALEQASDAGPTVALTRNESMLELLQAESRRLGVPLILELHWLKSVDHFRSWLGKVTRANGAPPAMNEAKERLRELRARERAALQRADGILCLTRGLMKTVARWQLNRPLGDLPSGVDVARFAAAGQKSGSPDDTSSALPRYDIVYAGQLYPWKGVDTLVLALDHVPGATLALAGGNDPSDVERVRAVGLEAGVDEPLRFLGQVPWEQVPGLLQRARVCVLPLPRAGFVEARLFTSPLKLFEYAASRCPIVASDLPSIREAVSHGTSAWLVAPDDPAALGEGIRAVLADAELAGRLSAGAERVAAAHDYSQRARRLLEFCRSVLQAEGR